MSAIRCPKCRLPLTHSEAKAGQCPSCGKRIETFCEMDLSSAAPVANANLPAQPKIIGTFTLFLVLVLCGFIGAIVQAMIFGFRNGSSGSPGPLAGIGIGMGILQGLGYKTRRQVEAEKKRAQEGRAPR